MAKPAPPKPAPGSYEAAFQDWMNSQSGYIGKTKKAEFKQNYQQSLKNNAALGEVMSGNPQTSLSMTGNSANEVAGRIEGLQRAKMLTGQNPYQIGQDYQLGMNNIRKRMDGSDTASELLRANKAGAVSDAKSSLRAQGVKGGAAAGAVAAVERQKAYDINNQVIQNQRQAQNDFMNAVKSNANFTTANEMNFGQLAAGKDVQAPPSNSGGFGALGTVICSELFRQGYMDRKTFHKDCLYGFKVLAERPHVYWGYRFMADPVVEQMKKSKTFTKVVAFLVLPWAKNMAGEKNVRGALLGFIGETVCGLVGKYYLGVGQYADQEKIRS